VRRALLLLTTLYVCCCAAPPRQHPREIPNAQEGQVRLEDIPEDLLRKSIVVVLDCDMAISNDNNEIQLSKVPPKNGDGLGFLPKVRQSPASHV
jgi:hypothetical protein